MNFPMGDGDGWVMCRRGHRHWGRFGAAGLLVRDEHRVILQHRAPWTHEGDAWGIPGGARDSHEDAVTAALREAFEEAALDPAAVRPTGLWVDDHGGWSYTSVLAAPLSELRPYGANAESTDVTWIDQAQVDSLTLHRGFARTWPTLRRRSAGLVMVLTEVNAPLGLLDPLVQSVARYGIDDRADAGEREGDHAALLPEVIVLLAGSPATAPGVSPHSAWWQRSIRTADPGRIELSQELLAAVRAGKSIIGVDGEQLESWLGGQSDQLQRAVRRITRTELLELCRPAA